MTRASDGARPSNQPSASDEDESARLSWAPMDLAIRRIGFALFLTTVVAATAGWSGFERLAPSADPLSAMPIDDLQPTASDAPNGVPAWSGGEVGVFAQALGATLDASDNAAAPRSPENDDATLATIRALREQVRSLESRIAAQDARIAMLERSLDDLQHKAGR